MTERELARRFLEEWGMPGPTAEAAVEALVDWWRGAEEDDIEPSVLVFNTAGEVKEVGAATFLEQFGIDLDRLVGNVER